MTRSMTHLGLTAMAAALAACSSGSSTTKSTSIFAADAGNAAQALADGKTLAAQANGAKTLRLNHATGETSIGDATFELVKNADGELTMMVNGKEYAFTTADRDPSGDGYVVDEADHYANLFNDRGSIDDALDTTKDQYAQVWGYYVWDGTEPNTWGQAIVGTETRPDALGSLPTATYNGYAQINMTEAEGYVDWNTSMKRVNGDLEMTADFGAGTISGQITNMGYRAPGAATWDPIAGSVAMDSTAISGNGYSGSLTPDADLQTSLDLSADTTGTYDGKFYGPSAEEVAGILTLTGTQESTGLSVNGVGVFIGN